MAYKSGVTFYKTTGVSNLDPIPTRMPWNLRLVNALNIVGATIGTDNAKAYVDITDGIFGSGVEGDTVEYCVFRGVQDNIRFRMEFNKTWIENGYTADQIPAGAHIESIIVRTKEWVSAWELIKQRQRLDTLLAPIYPQGTGAWGPYGAKSDVNATVGFPPDEDLFYLRNPLSKYVDDDGITLRNSHWRLEIVRPSLPTVDLQPDPRSPMYSSLGADTYRGYLTDDPPPISNDAVGDSRYSGAMVEHYFLGAPGGLRRGDLYAGGDFLFPGFDTTVARGPAYGSGFPITADLFTTPGHTINVYPKILFGWHCHEKAIQIVWKLSAIELLVNWSAPFKVFIPTTATSEPYVGMTSVPWTNPTRAIDDDNDYAEANHAWVIGELVQTDWLSFGGFDFSSIPPGSTPRSLCARFRVTTLETTKAAAFGFRDPYTSKWVDAADRQAGAGSRTLIRWKSGATEKTFQILLSGFPGHGPIDNSAWFSTPTRWDLSNLPTLAELQDPSFKFEISIPGLGAASSQTTVYFWAVQLAITYDDGTTPPPPGGTRHKPFSMAFGTWGNIGGIDNEEVKIFSLDG